MRVRWEGAIAIVVIVAVLSSCTTVPFSDQKLFKTFDQCMAGNLVLGAVSGAAVGIIIGRLTKQTGAGIGSGVATAALVALAAWHQCAKVYSTTRVEAQRSRDDLIAAGRLLPEPVSSLVFEELGARVDREAKAVDFDLGFTFIADSRDEKDIQVSIRHKLDIARMIDHEDKLVLADGAGKPLLDANGRPIPVKDFASLQQGQIVYRTFYDKTDMEVIQQGSRKIVHEFPAVVKSLQYPFPMRYTVSIDAGRFNGEQTLEFYLPDTPERPKTFAAKSPAVIMAKSGPPSGVLTVSTGPRAAQASGSEPTAGTSPEPPATAPRDISPETRRAANSLRQYTALKTVAIYESAGATNQVGRFEANTLLDLLESSTIPHNDDRAEVENVQKTLKQKGHDPGKVDGMMGPQTTAALRAYQKEQGLNVTGRLDAATLAKLGDGAKLGDQAGEPAVWLKVKNRDGVVGWVRKTNVVELK